MAITSAITMAIISAKNWQYHLPIHKIHPFWFKIPINLTISPLILKGKPTL